MQKKYIMLNMDCDFVFLAGDNMTLKQYVQNMRPTILVYCFMCMYSSICFKEMSYSVLRINKYLTLDTSIALNNMQF